MFCRKNVSFSGSGPTVSWLLECMFRHSKLKVNFVRSIDDKRIQALKPDHACEHIVRVEEAMKRFNILDPARIVNVDELGAAFKSLWCRSLRKRIRRAEKQLFHTKVLTRGNLDCLTVMGAVSAIGKEYRPAIIFQGMHARYCVANGSAQTLHAYLFEYCIYQRKTAGVDSAIFLDWTKEFLREKEELRLGNEYMLLVYNGYKCHVQLNMLQLFRESRAIGIELPAHTSPMLQPVDVSVYSSFNSVSNKIIILLFLLSISKQSVLDCSDVVRVVSKRFSESFTFSNIQSGFIKTELWNPTKQTASVDALVELPYFNPNSA